MSKITPLSGFPELLPAQRVVEREVIASLSRTFELHGFANIETRVVEPVDRLAKGGEVDKEIYVLRRIAAEPDAKAELGLHFDLTVPFARYVLEHAGHLEFPFRRFQMQPAWRGERPQEGRYRQFTQADVDIVGRDELPFHHDVEVMRGDGRRPRPAADPAAVVPVQQPQADPGLLPGPRHRRRHRRDPGHRQARQAARPTRSPGCWSSGSAPRPSRRSAASSSPPSASRTPRSWRRSGRSGSATSCSTRGSRSSRPWSRAAAPSPATAWTSRPTCASRGGSTTTPAPSSRSSWRATSGSSPSVGEGATTRSPATGVRRTPASACRSACPAPSSRSSPTASCPAAVPCRARPRRPQQRGRPHRQHRHRRRAAGPGRRLRGGPVAGEVRQADPLRRAARHPLRLVRPGRRHASQVKDIRTGEQVEADPATWTPPEADLRPRSSAPPPPAAPPVIQRRTSDPHP